MKWWEKFKEFIKKSVKLIGDFIVNAAAFSIALVKAPFEKTENKIPTSNEINTKYIEDIDKIITSEEKRENNDIPMDIRNKVLADEINKKIASLNHMELRDRGLTYLNVLQRIFDECEIKINEKGNYVLKFPKKEYSEFKNRRGEDIPYKKRKNGDLIIEKTLEIDKNGNFVSAERDYYNVHTHFKKTIFLDELDFNTEKMAIFKNTCKIIKEMKIQYEQTYGAKTYTENIKEMYAENTLTREKVLDVLSKMGVKIDEYGNILNPDKCNKFAKIATDDLISAIRIQYKIGVEENLLDNLDYKYDAMLKTENIIDVLENLDKCFKENNLTPELIEDLFAEYIGSGSISEPKPEITQSEDIAELKIQELANKIAIEVAEKICKKYDIDKDANFFESFNSRYNEINEERKSKEKDEAVLNIEEDKEELDTEYIGDLDDLDKSSNLEEDLGK